MNPPSDPNEPLLQSLAEEAADLPLRAASEARKTRARRTQRRRQLALTVTVLFCGVCAWQVVTSPDARRAMIAAQPSPSDHSSPLSPSENPDEPSAKSDPNDAPNPAPMPRPAPAPRLAADPKQSSPAPTASFPTPAASEPHDYVKMQTEKQAMNDPLPLPDGLTKEQENLVKAARGLPLLFVRDSAGKVMRIHVIER